MSTESQTREQPFDNLACMVLQSAVNEVVNLCPEVRSIGIALDYYGAHNDNPQLFKQIWLERNPEKSPPSRSVATLDALFGSLFSTLRLFQFQTERAQLTVTRLRELAVATGRTVANVESELRALQAETARLHAEVQDQKDYQAWRRGRDAGGGAAAAQD